MRRFCYAIGLLGLVGMLSADYAYGFGRNGGLFGRFWNRNSGSYRYRERGNFNNQVEGPNSYGSQVQYRGVRNPSPYPEDNGLCQNCPNGNCARVGWDPQVSAPQVRQLDYNDLPPYASTQPVLPEPVDPGYGVENRFERERLAYWYRNQGIEPRRAYWYRNRDEGNLDPGEAYYLRNRDDRNYRALYYLRQDDRDLARYALIDDRGRRGDVCDRFGLPVPDGRDRIDGIDARLRDLELRRRSDVDLDARLLALEQDRELNRNGFVAILRDRDGREIRRTRFGTACPLCLTLSPELAR